MRGAGPSWGRRREVLHREAGFGERPEVRVVALPDRVRRVCRRLLAGCLSGFLGGALVTQVALACELRPRGLSLAARRHLEHLYVRGGRALRSLLGFEAHL